MGDSLNEKLFRLGWVWACLWEIIFSINWYRDPSHCGQYYFLARHFEQCKRRMLAEGKQLCIHSFFVLGYGDDAFSVYHNFCVLKDYPGIARQINAFFLFFFLTRVCTTATKLKLAFLRVNFCVMYFGLLLVLYGGNWHVFWSSQKKNSCNTDEMLPYITLYPQTCNSPAIAPKLWLYH